MCNVFNGYELLLFKRFNEKPEEWLEWKNKLKEREEKGDTASFDIPQELWYLYVALHQRPRYLMQLVKDEIERENKHFLRRSGETLLTMYINMNAFTEFHLDSIFKYGEDNKLPKEIFKCANIRYLSLKYNCLYDIPPDIGFLQKLEYLALTNNRLHVQSIPYTLTFCRNLRTLLLDNNLLDALPGFLLQMQSLETVHRHGNHNYFKSTFMWYHTDIYCRIMEMNGTGVMSTKRPMSLSFWAAKALVGSKKNFFTDENVAPVLKDYLCGVYDMFNVCQNCPKACLSNKQGFKVITFKNPYLGNTCVPFQHWVCSVKCAQALEVPARLEQIAKAHKLDTQYERYVLNCQKEFFKCRHKHPLLACVVKVDGDLEEDSDCYSDVSCNANSLLNVSNTSSESTMDINITIANFRSSRKKKCCIM
ncbi:uncharacterized protein LOC128222068 [Mya arenaria]|uniref:uncharacterized protein LOC128208783 n=1 Tax=Mya arenaria TaxID=6604 RepID=UPI0022DF2E46|nr:uncharacterized protein LOC128208783 [Mya arenaria]XP_052786812.1 uncharacterized protein LOC128222068 [Mya arenaria]